MANAMPHPCFYLLIIRKGNLWKESKKVNEKWAGQGKLYLRVNAYCRFDCTQVFLESICSDNKSLPMGSLLARHIYWIGCTPKHTSVSLSLHSLSGIFLGGVVFYVSQGLNPCKQINKEVSQSSEPTKFSKRHKKMPSARVQYNIGEFSDVESSLLSS